ncbi:regulator SirB [Pseudohalioglobus sediminis]|uniref:Regulator SirB n=1 Tax=Pseudohalioglobus sediminis TaxID=2606449 RepID=A0A5B0WVG3_9GAMM|nr:SirB2 family protein [Pseudohalioglobus sediminis]KAA1190477.1 regulator SirB [Pseudohalioglobus sediminis]
MTAFTLLKTLHVTCALISVLGFALRGYWALNDNPLRLTRWARVAPHTVDTVLLGSALGMLWLWGVSPLQLDWVSAKILALLCYIAMGMVALRFGSSRRGRALAYIAALCIAAYIFAVALTHSPWGPLYAGAA